MARSGLRTVIGEAFHKAIRNRETIVLKNIKVGLNGAAQFVSVTIEYLSEPEPLRGMTMVVFHDVPPIRKTKMVAKAEREDGESSQISVLKEEYQRLQDELQSNREEMQSSQEELKSSNEELQSTNEELQSINEELTTSHEEMQSMNEELQTVNHELQAKVDELYLASNDMKNLLNSTDIAILFLDNALRIRRFTDETSNIIKLIATDAGRPISDISSSLDYTTMEEDSLEVLRTLSLIDKEVSCRDGRWFRARIIPYRTNDNRIDGVVITFFDITTTKQQEIELRKAQAALQVRYSDQTDELKLANAVEKEST